MKKIERLAKELREAKRNVEIAESELVRLTAEAKAETDHDQKEFLLRKVKEIEAEAEAKRALVDEIQKAYDEEKAKAKASSESPKAAEKDPSSGNYKPKKKKKYTWHPTKGLVVLLAVLLLIAVIAVVLLACKPAFLSKTGHAEANVEESNDAVSSAQAEGIDRLIGGQVTGQDVAEATPDMNLTAEQTTAIVALVNQAQAQGIITPAQATNPAVIQYIATQWMESNISSMLTPSDKTEESQKYLKENLSVSPEALKVLEGYFDFSQTGSDYVDAVFAIEGNTVTATLGDDVLNVINLKKQSMTFGINLLEGQTLYISAGWYRVVAPNGEVFTRQFGEETVANDYFKVPGPYEVTVFVVNTKESGRFVAAGLKVFNGDPAMIAEAQGSYVRPMDMHEDNLREASDDGMNKKKSYSRLVNNQGAMLETLTQVTSDSRLPVVSLVEKK